MGAWEDRCARGSVALLIGLGPLLAAAPASAQDSWKVGPLDNVGAGLFLGYTLGAERGLDWGVETFGTTYFQDPPGCSSQERAGFGPLVRLSILGGFRRWALTGALHTGREIARPLAALDVELGGTMAFQGSSVLGSIHTGFTLESIYWHAYARQQWLLPAYSYGGGMRVLPTFGLPSLCEVGRAYRNAAGNKQAPALRCALGFDRASPAARLWRARAGEECASILAFLQLARELRALAAPGALIERALRAADEELGHTQAASRLAAGFGGARVTIAPPQLGFRPLLPRRAALERLVTESWYDGLLNEGLASCIARAETSESRAPEETDVLAVITVEEAGHAALAFDVLCWALEQAPELARCLTLPAASAAEEQTPTLLAPAALRELVHENRREARATLRALSA